MAKKDVKKSEIFGWAMYDFANSSYTTVVISFVYAAFFTKFIVPEGSEVRDTYWAIAIIASTIIAIVLSPLVGAICDYTGGKKKYLFFTTISCAITTAALALAHPGQLWLAIPLIAISNAMFMLGESFVASFLPDLADDDNMGLISGLGWGLGYFGGLASLAMVYAYLGDPATQVNEEIVSRNQMSMVFLGAFYLLAAMPTFALVKDRSKPKEGWEGASFARLMGAGMTELKESYHLARRYKVLFQFLLAFMVYMAGLEVVIKFIGIYANDELSLPMSYLQILFIILQLSAAAGAVGFGFLEARLGAKATVMVTLFWWMGGVLAIYFLNVIAGILGVDPNNVFMGIAVIAGAGIGSIQSSSRAVVGLLSPADRSAQMFGFWGMFSRLAIILGMTFGPVSDMVGRRTALLLVVAFFAVGALMLWRVPINEQIEANQKAKLAEASD